MARTSRHPECGSYSETLLAEVSTDIVLLMPRQTRKTLCRPEQRSSFFFENKNQEIVIAGIPSLFPRAGKKTYIKKASLIPSKGIHELKKLAFAGLGYWGGADSVQMPSAWPRSQFLPWLKNRSVLFIPTRPDAC